MTSALSGLAVVVNGDAVVQYDRSKPLPERQLQYLDKMDAEMDAGVILDGEAVERPDGLQRAQFVALQLLHALRENQDARIAALCSYLANRLPDLQQVKADDRGGMFSIDLVFDQPYAKPAVVQFVKPPPKPKGGE